MDYTSAIIGPMTDAPTPDDRNSRRPLKRFGLSPLRWHMQSHARGILLVCGIILLGLLVYLGLTWAVRLR